VHFFERRNAIVPFQQRGGAADQFHGVRVELPDRIEHRMIVRIENILLELRMPRDVNLSDPMRRDIVQVFVGIEIVVFRGDINVVHVEQNPAVGSLDHFGEKFPFRHFRGVKFRVAAHILDANRHLEKITRLANIGRGGFGSGKGVRHREQIMRIASVHAPPAKMIAQPRGIRSPNESLYFL